jgi:hypothetical protein
MTLRGMDPKERAVALKMVLGPLAWEVLRLAEGDVDGAISIFERAHREIVRLASRVSGVWRHNHYEVSPGRGLCGIARPAMYMTRRRYYVTCSRCQKRLGFTPDDHLKVRHKRSSR